MPPSAVSPRSEVIDILAHFDLENEAEKTLIQQISQPPKRFHLTSLLVICWGVVCLGISAMVVLAFPDIIAMMQQEPQRLLFYSVQIPMVVLVAGVLGQRYGTLTIFLYLVAGFLGLPVFAGGGGFQYFNEMSAGYLLGFFLVPWTIQKWLTKAYHGTKWFRGRSLWMLFGALLGVVIIHFVGLLGIGFQTLAGALTLSQAQEWVYQLTWPTILYDFALSCVAVALVRPLRMLLWFCLY
jgi:biotin transporter BioY